MKKSILIILICITSLISEIGQLIWLPLWLDSTNQNAEISGVATKASSVSGSYGVLLISSIFEMLIFLILYLIFGKFDRFMIGKYFLIGIALNILNAIFTPFLSTSYRNNPTMQAVLSNFYVPLTIFIRIIWLKRFPTVRKSICTLFVILGVSLSLIPDIFLTNGKLSPKNPTVESKYLVIHRVFWTLGFILLSVLPETLFNVCIEKVVKDGDINICNNLHSLEESSSNCTIIKKVSKYVAPPDIFYLCFVMSLGQLIGACVFFWLDLIPNLGFSIDMRHFSETLKKTILCSTGHGCRKESLGFAIGYIISYVVGMITSAALIKNSEGCTMLAFIMNLATPLAVLFWVLFSTEPLRWSPHFDSTKWFSIASVFIIIPAVIVYNTGDSEIPHMKVKNEHYEFS